MILQESPLPRPHSAFQACLLAELATAVLVISDVLEHGVETDYGGCVGYEMRIESPDRSVMLGVWATWAWLNGMRVDSASIRQQTRGEDR